MTDKNPNDYQIGGDHYSQAGNYQHWDFIEEHEIGYLEGYSTKYLVRWDKKGTPVQDLEKSLHTVTKLIELAQQWRNNRSSKPPTTLSVNLFCSANRIGNVDIRRAIENLLRWKTLVELEEAKELISKVLEEQPSRILKREYDKGGKLSRHDGMERPFGFDAKEEGVSDEKDIYGQPPEALREETGGRSVEAGKDSPASGNQDAGDTDRGKISGQ